MQIEFENFTPDPPIIRKIVNGNRSITLEWTGIPNPKISGYLVYRTDDTSKINDSGRMELIKKAGDKYSVTVSGTSKANHYEFIDNSVEAKKYWYRVVTISEEESGIILSSKMSSIVSCQAWIDSD